MMSTLRDKRTMQIVLWTLVVGFVGALFFGFGMRFTSGGKYDSSVDAAKVGDEAITREEFSKAYQPVLDKIYAAEPQGPTSEETQRLQEKVLNSLIDDAILGQTAQKLGISVPDEELAASIRREPYFADQNGNFDKDRYLQVLQANQLTPEQFEADQRQALQRQKIRTVLLDGVLFTGSEVDYYASLLNRALKSDYVVLDESAYEKNLQPKGDELRDFYENTRNQYDHPERVKVRHLFLTTPQNEGFQDPEKVKKTLEEYRQEVLSGKAQFSDLAKKYSEDGQTKNLGGEIGWIERGSLPKDMEDNIFGLKKGEITQPFKLQSGYDIALIEDSEKAYKSTFEEVHSKVLDQYLRQKASEKIALISEQLAGKMKDDESLEKAAKELGLPASATDWFNRDKGIPHMADSKGTADELASLYIGDWKGPIPVDKKVYFFQITDAQPVKGVPTLTDQERVEITQRMVSESQQSWLKDFLAAERKKLGVKTYL